MLLRHRGWIFWLIQATTFLSLIEVAEFNVLCDSHCAFLRASKCMFLQQPVYECANDDTHFLPSVSALLENLPQSIRDSVLNGTFATQNIEDLEKVSPSLLSLIPARLINFNAENVCSYVRNHSHDSAAALKLVSSLNSSLERRSFLEDWNGDESNPKMEDIVASALTKWQRDTDWNFLALVDSNTTVLLHIPPGFLLTFDSKEASEFLFHLGSKFNSMPPSKIIRVFRSLNSNGSKFLQRAWAVLAVRELPDKIKWTKYSFVLPGLTLDELNDLDIDDIKQLLAYDFSAVQIRTIVKKILIPWNINFKQATFWVKYLAPAQIQAIWRLNLKDLGIMANQTASYATAKQLLLYQLYPLNEKNVKEGKYPNLSSTEDLIKLNNGFISLVPLKIIEEVTRSSVLTLESLQKIDTKQISLTAAYYLTDKSNAFNLEKPAMRIINIKGLLKAIPTAKIMGVNGDMSSLLLHHLLQHLRGDNILRNLELLRKCRPTLGNADYVLKFLLKNEDKNDYFSLLSPKDVVRISLNTINSLERDNYGQRVKELPHHILAAMLSNNSPGSWTWHNMFNSSNAFPSLLMGLNCNEMRKIEYSDFISIIGRYNDDRLKIGKVFPKNLQRCGQSALSKYLLLKSNLYNEPELLDLLEPSDIEAVGGYILTSLSAEEILHAKYSPEIISAIGQLSLPELMLAASREHLNALMDVFLNTDVNQSDLLMLRNLIHFISAPNLGRIKPKDLKYIIESDAIDKRLCADSETRKAWSDLLISVYGFPSKWNTSQLESMGDFMIAFSSDQLDTVEPSQWQLLADVAVTKYTEIVEWPKTATFYQACLSTLIKSEQKLYIEAVKSLQRKYFTEVQRLVGSIKLKVKDDSMVLIKTNISSLGSSLKPEVITPDEESNSSEEIPDENTIIEPFEEHPEEDSQETTVYPTTSEGPPTSGEVEPSPKNASAYSINLASKETTTPSSVNYNPGPRDGSSLLKSLACLNLSKDQNEESRGRKIQELCANLSSSSDFPVITEVSTGVPPAIESETFSGSTDDYMTVEFSTILPDVISESNSNTEFSVSLDSDKAPLNLSFLSKDIFSEDEKDTSAIDSHPQVVEPEEAEDNSEPSILIENTAKANEEIVADNLDDDLRRSGSSFSTTVKRPVEMALERQAESNASSRPTEKPFVLFQEFFPNFFVPVTTTESPSSDSAAFASTTTEAPDFDIGDQINARFFGNDFASEMKKLNKGFSSLLGFEKDSKIISSTTSSNDGLTTSLSSDFSTTSAKVETHIMKADFVETESAPEAAELKGEKTDPTRISDYSTSTEPLTTITEEQPEYTTEVNTEKYGSESEPTKLPNQSNPQEKERNLKEEEISPSEIFDFNPGNLTDLVNLSGIIELDYEQPKAEVFDKEDINDSEDNQNDFSGHLFDFAEPPVGLSASKPAKRSARSVTPSFPSDSEPITAKVGINKEVSSSRGKMESPFNSVFCDSVKTLGQSAELVLQEFDFYSVTNDDLLNCVEDLGKLDLPLRVKEIIWQRIKSLGLPNMALGSLVEAWKVDDVLSLNLNLSQDWTLEIVHLLSKYNKDSLVANILVDQMRKQIFSREVVVEVPEAVSVALGPLLCYFNLTELQLIFQTPGTFTHVIPVVGNMIKGCQSKCLSKLAILAAAFMDSPDSWTSDIVALLGPIPAGLDAENWRLLASSPRAIAGLQPRALECLPQSFLPMMSVEAMANLSPLTTKVLTDKQLILLNKQQKDILLSIKYEHWSLRSSITVPRPGSEKPPKPNIEVDPSSSSDITTPSVIIFTCLLTVSLSSYFN